MNRRMFFNPMGLLIFFIFASFAAAAESPRQRLSMNEGWSFRLGKPGDTGDATYSYLGKTNNGFHGTSGTLTLPHDWALALPPNQQGRPTNAFKPLGPGFPETSIGWYGRTFTVPQSEAGRRFWIEFGGIFRESQIWVNGYYAGRHESGYDSFRLDVTDLLEPGKKNDICVRVDASQGEGWWYEGAGIYRNVWLMSTDPVAIAPDGVYVRTIFKDNVPQEKAELAIEAKIENKTEATSKVGVRCRILDSKGVQVSETSTGAEVPALGESTIKVPGLVNNPALWSPETPVMYTLVTTIEALKTEIGGDPPTPTEPALAQTGQILDRVETPFAFRTIQFDAAKGFLLNGKPCVIKGVCIHHDHAGVGTAIPPALEAYRIGLLKEMGCNAIRMSHNPASPEFMDLCDRLGMLVMDETRTFDSTPYGLGQLERLLLRDRNHPSVFIWCLGNEEPVQMTPMGERVMRTLTQMAHRLDPSRQATMASNRSNVFKGVNSVADVHGWNYGGGAAWIEYHKAHPEQPTILTEQRTGRGTRGVYFAQSRSGFSPAYGVTTWWKTVVDNPWTSGGFYWTGFDYAGESTKNRWPVPNSNFGVMDRCGFPKDEYYCLQANWVERPVLHLLPHWNWEGKSAQPIEVRAYTNCDAVELFLNGKSLGKQPVERCAWTSWTVAYTPGTLEAKGYKGSAQVAEDKVETTGAPTALRLTTDRKTLNGDGVDVVVANIAVVDDKGRVVPTADNAVKLKCSGQGAILGSGNGNPATDDSQIKIEGQAFGPLGQVVEQKTFNGLAQVIVQAGAKPGAIGIEIESPGLQPAKADLEVKSAPLTPAVAVGGESPMANPTPKPKAAKAKAKAPKKAKAKS